MRHFGYFVTEGSIHQTEYYPYFRKRPDLLNNLYDRFTVRPGSQNAQAIVGLRRDVGNYYKWFDEQLDPEKRIEIRRSGEYGARIIHAMETNSPIRINGNVPNKGAITNLPDYACVEVPCMIDANGIHPMRVGALPVHLAALCSSNLYMQELVAQGFVQKDQTLIRHAVNYSTFSTFSSKDTAYVA